jgi:hypothetical protein
VHRLRDIVVEEVSLVDRAANKRRFLVVKRSSQMAGDEAKDRGTSQEGRAAPAGAQGGKKTKPKPGDDVDKARPRAMRAAAEDDDESDDEDEETEKAGRSAKDEEDDEDEETEKARRSAKDEEHDEDEDTEKADEEDDESKAGKARPRAKRGARAGDGANGDRPRGRAGKPTDKADDDGLVLPATVKNALLRVLAQALERLMAVANQIKEADAADDDTEPNVPDDLAEELEDIGELLEDVGDQLADPAAKADGKKRGAAKGRAAKGDVTKAGRRMAKDRLDRFQKALEALSAILKELTDAKAPPGPSAGSAASALSKRNAAAGIDDLVAGVQELTRGSSSRTCGSPSSRRPARRRTRSRSRGAGAAPAPRTCHGRST